MLRLTRKTPNWTMSLSQIMEQQSCNHRVSISAEKTQFFEYPFRRFGLKGKVSKPINIDYILSTYTITVNSNVPKETSTVPDQEPILTSSPLREGAVKEQTRSTHHGDRYRHRYGTNAYLRLGSQGDGQYHWGLHKALHTWKSILILFSPAHLVSVELSIIPSERMNPQHWYRHLDPWNGVNHRLRTMTFTELCSFLGP